MSIKIIQIEHCDEQLIKAFERLAPQLSENAPIPTAERLQRIISSPTSHLLAATTDDGTIAGVLTLVFFDIPTYCKAWIEDVVVDSAHRGKGYGKLLVDHAIEYARTLSPCTLMLTSNPSRIAANELYRNSGFEPKITNVYKMTL